MIGKYFGWIYKVVVSFGYVCDFFKLWMGVDIDYDY